MFCKNCKKPIDDDAKFCIYCGATVSGLTQSAQPGSGQKKSPPPPQVKASGIKVWGLRLISALVVILVCIGLYYFNGDLRAGFDEGFKEAFGGSSAEADDSRDNRVKYSALSAEAQDELLGSLYEKLDKYFLTVLRNDEQLMQLFMLGAMGNQNEEATDKMFENTFVGKITSGIEDWVKENNVDVEDFGNSIDADEFTTGYFMHLMQLLLSSENN